MDISLAEPCQTWPYELPRRTRYRVQSPVKFRGKTSPALVSVINIPIITSILNSIHRKYEILFTGNTKFYPQEIRNSIHRKYEILSTGNTKFYSQEIRISIHRKYIFLSTGNTNFYPQAIRNSVHRQYEILFTGNTKFCSQEIRNSIHRNMKFYSQKYEILFTEIWNFVHRKYEILFTGNTKFYSQEIYNLCEVSAMYTNYLEPSFMSCLMYILRIV